MHFKIIFFPVFSSHLHSFLKVHFKAYLPQRNSIWCNTIMTCISVKEYSSARVLNQNVVLFEVFPFQWIFPKSNERLSFISILRLVALRNFCGFIYDKFSIGHDRNIPGIGLKISFAFVFVSLLPWKSRQIKWKVFLIENSRYC